MKKKNEYKVLRLRGADDVRLRAFENMIHAGVPSDPGDARGEDLTVREWLGLSGDEIYVLEVMGDCMVDADIYSGDTVLVEKAEPQNGNIVAARVNGECILRRFYRESNAVWLVPQNASKGYMPMMVTPQDDFEIQGVVVSVSRNLRKREYGVVARLRSEVDKIRVKRMPDSMGEKLDPLAEELKGCFYGDKSRASVFLSQIRGMEATQITELVNEYVRRKWISELSKKMTLWDILYRAKLYDKGYKNWCKYVN